MAIKVCPNGHHYNTDDNPTCPYCDRANNGSDFEWSEMDISSTAVSKTAPIGSNLNSNWNGKTEPITPHGESYFGETVPIINERKTKDVQDSYPTQPSWNNTEYQHQPVVGWLVCIEGPDKGKDFCLHGAKSTIGRRKDSSVVLNDPRISRNGFPALVVYDDRKTHKFYLASGDAASENNVELDGNMLLGQSIIKPYDEIRIENTVLVFVPFCGDEFFWKEG